MVRESPGFAVHLPFSVLLYIQIALTEQHVALYSMPLHSNRVSCHLRGGSLSVSDISAVYLSIQPPLESQF